MSVWTLSWVRLASPMMSSILQGYDLFPLPGMRREGAPLQGEFVFCFQTDDRSRELILCLFFFSAAFSLRLSVRVAHFGVARSDSFHFHFGGGRKWGVMRDWRTQIPLAVQKEFQGFFKSLKGSQKSIILYAISQF